ncbi:hypothetical protein HIM_03775 [Hirsutella minnesotensis 3608]|uniref:Capsule polysaccharide biosynthesis protein n=1 Tax=Hirsutella minnesotensis 3608 TaxID=1043627 RepID=A0A0F7ZVN0_9HYPO|nr:hypothetical protein HIM_03775 [Hirsutella minnesotensis 3608]
MASASSKVGGLAMAVRVLTPLAVGSVGYAAWRVNWPVLVRSFLTGPGRTSRILLLFFVLFNWKNMPFAWTYRIFYSIVYHHFLRKSPQLPPRALFKPIITETRAPLLEIDYNLHKSNSTYFTDLDVSRTHLVSYLCQRGLHKLTDNKATKLVLDPATGHPVGGSMGIMLGAVSCSFKREIGAYRGYELWSRVLCWDRKWLYVMTHFVPKGAARPTEWLDPPSRPGGWTSGEHQLGNEAANVGDIDLTEDGEWGWRRVEAQRRHGMDMVGQFRTMDDMHALFDGGSNGALGKFGPC